MNKVVGAAALGAAIALWTAVSSAQQKAPSGNHDPTAAEQQEARQRFERALSLSDDGDFDAALVELRKAYELAPTYRILYNIGLIYQQLKEYARAYDAFDQYLREGGAEAEHAEDARRRFEHLKGRVAYLNISVNEPNADVTIDDLSVGKTPLTGEVHVNSGQRKVTVTLPGRLAQTRIIEVAGGDRRALHFALLHDAPPVILHEGNRSIAPYIAWGATVLLGAGAATTGGLALAAASNYDSKVNQFVVQNPKLSSDINDAYDAMRALSVTTDILLGATVVAVGISLYLTLKPSRAAPSHAANVGVLLVPGGVVGTF